MSTVAFLFAAAVAGALGRRFAGGLMSQWLRLDLGDAPVRVLWGAMLAGVAVAAGLPWQYAAAIVPCVFLGSTVGYYGAMSAGNQPGRSVALDWLLLTLHGLAGTALLSIAAWYQGLLWWPLLAAGAACAPCYAAAWRCPIEFPALGCLRVDPPPTAELMWGATVGIAVASIYF